MDVDASFDGFDEFERDLTVAVNTTESRAERVVARSAGQVRDTAKSLTDSVWTRGYATGESKASIDVLQTGTAAWVAINARGGFFQEVGTVNHPPRPVLSPALDRHQADFVNGIARLGDI